MESQRSFLFIALMVVTFLLFQQWQLDNAPVVQPQDVVTQNNASTATATTDDFVPTSSGSGAQPPQTTKASAGLIEVTTDVLAIKINTQGGDIVEATLLDYETE